MNKKYVVVGNTRYYSHYYDIGTIVSMVSAGVENDLVIVKDDKNFRQSVFLEDLKEIIP